MLEVVRTVDKPMGLFMFCVTCTLFFIFFHSGTVTAQETLTQENWSHPYSRQIALANLSEKSNKYFPPVGRIDNVFGDRNLVCSCPPIEAYEHEQT